MICRDKQAANRQWGLDSVKNAYTDLLKDTQYKLHNAEETGENEQNSKVIQFNVSVIPVGDSEVT